MSTVDKKYENSVNEFVEFAKTLDPTGVKVHVNGRSHLGALVVADFGDSLDPVEFSADQMNSLHSNLRELGAKVLGRQDTKIRVSADTDHGIYWAHLT